VIYLLPIVILALSAVLGLLGVVLFFGDSIRLGSREEARLAKWMIEQQGNQPVEELFKDKSRSQIGALDRMLRKMPSANKFERMFWQADLRINVGTFLLGSATCGAFGLLIGLLLQRMIVGLVLAGVLTVIPYLFLKIKRRRRLAAIEAQLPDALDLIVRSLRAGHSFANGLKIVSQEMEKPIAAEFDQVVNEHAFGVSLTQALQNLVDRVDLQDIRFFTTAVILQRETGGNLTEVLSSLSMLIRERFKLKRQIKAISAEGRLSGLILTLLPVGLFAMLLLTNPTYIEPLYKSKAGQIMVGIGLAMQLLGILFIKKIVNIKV
jgi:tight adherence protein B